MISDRPPDTALPLIVLSTINLRVVLSAKLTRTVTYLFQSLKSSLPVRYVLGVFHVYNLHDDCPQRLL